MATLLKKIREYVDFSDAFTRNPLSDQLNVKKNREAVKQSVRNILLTRKGERPFDPNFGSPIYDFLFENYSPPLATIISTEISRILELYEPRIDVNKVVVQFQDNYSIRVHVEFVIVNTTEPVTVSVLVNRLR